MFSLKCFVKVLTFMCRSFFLCFEVEVEVCFFISYVYSLVVRPFGFPFLCKLLWKIALVGHQLYIYANFNTL